MLQINIHSQSPFIRPGSVQTRLLLERPWMSEKLSYQMTSEPIQIAHKLPFLETRNNMKCYDALICKHGMVW